MRENSGPLWQGFYYAFFIGLIKALPSKHIRERISKSKLDKKKSGEAPVVFWAEVEATTAWLLLASPFLKNPIPDKETYRFAFASLALWCEGRGA